MIKNVSNIYEANRCDDFLNKLILDERKYDDTIDKDFVVKDYFCNIFKNEMDILLIYVMDDNIVAYIYAKRISNDSSKSIGYLIDGLYVEEKYRNQGIGKKLIKEVISRCSINGCSYIDINVMYKNELAKNLYNSLNFNELKLTLRLNIK